MDSGWIAFTVLMSLLVIGGLVFFTSSIWYPRAETGGNIFVVMMKTVINVIFNIVPISLFGFGIVADIIKTEVRASIPTLSAFFSLILLRLGFLLFGSTTFPLFASSGAETNTATYWCSLPGLEFLENPVFPGSVLSTTIIAFYYIWWAIGTPNQTVILAYMLFAYSASLFQFILGNCSSLYYPLPFLPFGPSSTVLIQTTLLGLIISGSVYGLISGIFRSLDPLANLRIPGFPIPGAPVPVTPGSGITCPEGKYFDTDTGQCWCNPGTSKSSDGVTCGSPPMRCGALAKWDDRKGQCVNNSSLSSGQNGPQQSGVPQEGEQTFVAELYKNGQLVTDSISK